MSSLELYGGVTDPTAHTHDGAFRYLVHAVHIAGTSAAITNMYSSVQMGRTHDPSWGNQSIKAYEHPRRIAERVSLSMSLIDEQHRSTWGDGGLIIAAPIENIVITSPR